MKLLIGALLLAALGAGAGAAQAAGPCGADQMVTMRVSKLTAGGTAAGFAEAVRDHKAWYASRGLKDDAFVTGPALEPRKGGMVASATQFVTFHVYGGTTEPKHDAAWDAYVAKYRANSTIASEARFCLPKGAAIGR